MGSSHWAASAQPSPESTSINTISQESARTRTSSESRNTNMADQQQPHQYGYPSPPPSGSASTTTTYSPTPNQPMPNLNGLSQRSSPFQTQDHMAVYQSSPGLVSSPSPIARSPYPQPSSQSTMTEDPSVEELAQFREWQHKQQLARLNQPPPNMLPHQPFYGQPQQQQVLQQQQPQYGQFQPYMPAAHGLPGQQMQPQYAVKPGHRYGNITATGNARVIRGNVFDNSHGRMNERQHSYGDASYTEKARIVDGDVTSDMMKGFWDQN